MQEPSAFKVVLVFDLLPGMADEELSRSRQRDSFPDRLSRQPGFLGMELVKITDARTMSVQSWRSADDWWAALKSAKSASATDAPKSNILVERTFFAGEVWATQGPQQ